MIRRLTNYLRQKLLLIIFIGFILGIFVSIYSNKLVETTSTPESCEMCHVHPQATDSWKLSVHYNTRVGIHIGCADCHLPPKGQGYLKEKIKASARDFYGLVFKDSADFNWEAKSSLEQAQRHVFKASCLKCHANLFPLTLNEKGQDAHLYYTQHEEELRCINCHLNVGHYDPNALHAKNVEFGSTGSKNQEKFEKPALVESLTSFTETVPGTTISFDMKAIPGGSFKMGSPETESLRDADEGPQKSVSLSPFFMAEVEVTWDEYLAFYTATAAEGRSTDTEGSRTNADVDAISGPTPSIRATRPSSMKGTISPAP